MNRDDVIRLIERVSNKALYTMVGEEPIYTSETEDEIFKKLDSSGVAEAVTDAVGDAVADLVRVKEYFEAVSLPVSFNIFLNVDDINEEGEYINGVRTLHDYVGVEFPLKNEYYYSGKRNTKTYVYHEPAEDSDEELDELYGTGCVSFSDFVVALNERGFELEGIKSYSEIKKACLEGKSPQAEVTVAVSKDKVYTKK